MSRNESLEERAYLEDLAARVRASWPAQLPNEAHFAFGPRPLPDYAREWARTDPSGEAIFFYGRMITWGELDRWSDGIAAWLQRRGVRKGDRVALLLPTCPQYIIAFLGVLKAGAIVVPISVMAKTLEAEHYLEDSGASVLIAQDQLLGIINELPPERRPSIVLASSVSKLLPSTSELPVPPGLDALVVAAEAEAFEDAMNMAPQAPVALSWDDPAVINYTGGTTGLPKGCIHAHGDLVYTGASSATFSCPGGRGNVFMNYLPMFWIGGEVTGILTPLVSGAPIVLLARWDAETVMRVIERYQVTTTWMLVDNVVEILDHPAAQQYRLNSLRNSHAVSFVKVLTREIRQRWQAISGSVLRETSWGMTETNTLDTFTTGFQQDDFDLSGLPTFVGLPMPGTEFKIVDSVRGSLMPFGAEGELCVRTPSLFDGYWNNEAGTEQSLRGGWLHTGDTALIDERGFITFRGRTRDMLKVNGVSVFPAEVEALLMRHPAIAACGVIGRSDDTRGQVPVAFIRLKPGADESSASLVQWCRANMAVYKQPEIRVVDTLPLTSTGKVKRAELHELL